MELPQLNGVNKVREGTKCWLYKIDSKPGIKGGEGTSKKGRIPEGSRKVRAISIGDSLSEWGEVKLAPAKEKAKP